MSAAKPEISEMDFETAIYQLEKIVNSFESGHISLEKSIEEYTKAIELKNQCEKKLSNAKLKVEKITPKEDGSISTEEFNYDS